MKERDILRIYFGEDLLNLLLDDNKKIKYLKPKYKKLEDEEFQWFWDTFDSGYHDESFKFITLLDKDEDILGVCQVKMDFVSQQLPVLLGKRLVCLSFISIPSWEQGRGHTRTLIQKLCQHMKDTNRKYLYMSKYTSTGYEKLKPIVNEYCKKYQINLIDRGVEGEFEIKLYNNVN